MDDTETCSHGKQRNALNAGYYDGQVRFAIFENLGPIVVLCLKKLTSSLKYQFWFSPKAWYQKCLSRFWLVHRERDMKTTKSFLQGHCAPKAGFPDCKRTEDRSVLENLRHRLAIDINFRSFTLSVVLCYNTDSLAAPHLSSHISQNCQI